jgi:hypothetical protein
MNCHNMACCSSLLASTHIIEVVFFLFDNIIMFLRELFVNQISRINNVLSRSLGNRSKEWGGIHFDNIRADYSSI